MIRRTFLVALLALVMGLAGLGAEPTAAYAQAPPWGACGNSTPNDKVVRTFPVNHRLNFQLRCGTPNGGYRHLLDRHRGDFQQQAFGTGMNWRDVADLAMATIAADPDSAKPAGDGKGCYSRVLFLRNNRTNQVVRQQIFAMIVVVSTGDIITAYPTSRQCR
jgi:hypothetical protein